MNCLTSIIKLFCQNDQTEGVSIKQKFYVNSTNGLGYEQQEETKLSNSKNSDPSLKQANLNSEQEFNWSEQELNSKIESIWKRVTNKDTPKLDNWQEKMLKNSLKEIRDKNKNIELEGVKKYLSALSNKNSQPLKFSMKDSTHQGDRLNMEDRHFYSEKERGLLFGVFDGHNGDNVARYAKEQFPEFFWKEQDKTANISEVFNNVNNKIHEEVKQVESLNHIGTTATICFIDKNNYIYTSTLGDSEAYIYRKIDDEYKFIPLSCVRDWDSDKDSKRVTTGQIKKFPNSKTRWETTSRDTNIARAIGDCYSQGVLSHKSKNTINKVLPGDIIIIASDGLWDFLNQDQIIAEIKKEEDNLSGRLVDRVLINKDVRKDRDNITVMTIKAQDRS